MINSTTLLQFLLARFAIKPTLMKDIQKNLSAEITIGHDFEQNWLWLDIDLSPLPVSKLAQASHKDKISGKKTAMVAN